MGRFFTRERFGKPQFLAGFLLLLFVAQSLWLLNRAARSAEPEAAEHFRINEGLRQWRQGAVAGTPAAAPLRSPFDTPPPELDANDGYDPNHSPLWYLIAAAPLLFWQHPLQADFTSHTGWLAQRWFECFPYILFGVLLGASLWYVTRRLYGNSAGYIALTLYCFSPAILRTGVLWSAQPEMGAAFGAFGMIFTAIAVAHTLYAPREVVLWNWRRILLLGVSLTLAVGSQFSLVILAPVALLFMWYLAPERRRAAFVIWAGSCFLSVFLALACYSFHPGILWQGIRHADFLGVTGRAYLMEGAYERLALNLATASPALTLAMPLALAVFVSWKRARYFGNTVPLIVGGLSLMLGLGSPHYPGLGFLLVALPFLFAFIAGVCADLLETKYRDWVLASVAGLLIAYALWNLMALIPAARG